MLPSLMVAPELSGAALAESSGEMGALEPFPNTGFARVVSVVVMLTALLVLTGWMLDVAWLTSIAPAWPKMPALTALGLLFASGSLWLSAAASSSAAARRVRIATAAARCLATLVLCIGVVGLITRLAGWNLRLDTLSMERLEIAGISPAGSMATATALSLILLGCALLLVQRSRWRQLHQISTLLVALIGGLGLSRYVYGGAPLTPYAAMAIHTAAVLLLLAAGTLSLRRDVGLMALLTSPRAGGAVMRMLLPATVVVPLAAGALTFYLADGTAREAAVSLFALVTVVVLALAVWFTATLLERSDIQRHEAQRAFESSKERIRLIIESALDAVISIDSAGQVTDWNAQAEAMFGWRRQEALGCSLADLIIPAQHRSAHSAGLQRYVRGAPPRILDRRIEMMALRRDGREFPVELAITAIDAEQGLSFSAFVRDITERRATLLALQAGEAHLREQLGWLQLLDTTTRAISERQDLCGIFQVVLRNLEEHLHIDFGCMCLYESGAPLLKVACIGTQSQHFAAQLALGEQARIYIDNSDWSRCVRGELVCDPDTAASVNPFCVRLLRAGLRSVVFAPLSVGSEVLGVLIAARRQQHAFTSPECEFLRQLSDHVALAANQAQLYGALQRAYEDLRHSQQSMMQHERLRAVGQLASGIAHDINNTLSPAGLYVQFMLEREAGLSERSRGYLDVVRRAIESVADTVARLRTFYLPSEAELQVLAVDLNEVLQQVVDLTRARWTDMAQERGATIQLQLALQRDLPKVAGSANEIRDALTNLVLNAVDAMPAGGTLSLRTWATRIDAQQCEVCIEVGDNGMGMDEQQRNRCLEPFYTTKGERGSGLGLTMVYAMVQRHGAQLQIDSQPGHGTLMRLIFPLTPARAASQTVLAGEPQESLRILLIDDDPLILDSLKHALTEDGHELVAVAGGKAGIDSFADAEQDGRGFEVVITDLGMPHVDGRKVAAAVKSVAPRTPVIMLTGWGRHMLADDDKPEHVDRVLSKPPRLPEIRRVLAELATQSLSES
jgi:PAS domain S-box-containing protein